MNKILISGGAGFIGANLVKLLLKWEPEWKIVVADALTYAGDKKRLEEISDNPRFSFYQVDITQKEKMREIWEREKPQGVIHLAAESHVDRSIKDPSPFILTNVLGTEVLLELSLEFGVSRFLHVSTDEVYGELKDKEGKFTEEHPLAPSSPYSASKAGGELLVKAYERTFNLPVVIVRPSNNYGPWQYPEKLIPVVIWQALHRQPVPVYGRGENWREWLYVEDCAQGIYTAFLKGREGEIYNLGSGEERQNLDTVKTILSLLGEQEDLIQFVPDRPGHDFRYFLDNQKAKRELNWEAKTKFEEGIKKTVDWYIKNIKWVEEKIKEIR
ncbi:MAG: dTDP-glucose 4,6-dehydratase [Atribacterales bacterium]